MGDWEHAEQVDTEEYIKELEAKSVDLKTALEIERATRRELQAENAKLKEAAKQYVTAVRLASEIYPFKVDDTKLTALVEGNNVSD